MGETSGVNFGRGRHNDVDNNLLCVMASSKNKKLGQLANLQYFHNKSYFITCLCSSNNLLLRIYCENDVKMLRISHF